MKVGDSVRKAIDDWEIGDHESAMLHACNAIDGTAKKIYPKLLNKDRFTRLLRESYEILGPMGVPGIDLVESRFDVPVKKPTAPGGEPDIADIIYGIHRCTHGHGDELPTGFELLPDAVGPKRITKMKSKPGSIQLSDRIIFGLLAVAVFSPVNEDQSVPDGYFLSFSNIAKMMINEWWGRASDFPDIAAQDPVPQVKLVFK